MNFTIINNATGTSEGYALVKSCDRKTSKNGSAYLDIVLADKSGEISAKLWDYKEGMHGDITANIIVKVRGVEQMYNKQPQYRIERIRTVTPEDNVDLNDFVPSAGYDEKFLNDLLYAVIDSVKDQQLHALLTEIFAEYGARMCTIPGAFRLHHAIRGGLITHTLSIVQMAEAAAKLYPAVDRDLLITGALLHDVAKTEEFVIAPSGLVSGYSLSGELLGHLVMGAMIVERAAAKLGTDEKTKMYLQHMLLSHHGDPQFGAAIRPSFLEAEILSQLDMLDARIYEIENAIGAVEVGGFSARQWALDDRKFLNHGRKPVSTAVQFESPAENNA
ncbi:MAG: HD domain-containing protein [Clostridia bacterium]|nr:HD domain-containing protein [Clostridia bacterium]